MLKFLLFLSVIVILANAAVGTVFVSGLNERGQQEFEKMLSVFK